MELISIVMLVIGMVTGALITAVWFLDHQPGEKRRKWWHDV